jgi:hypothetical protein
MDRVIQGACRGTYTIIKFAAEMLRIQPAMGWSDIELIQIHKIAKIADDFYVPLKGYASDP